MRNYIDLEENEFDNFTSKALWRNASKEVANKVPQNALIMLINDLNSGKLPEDKFEDAVEMYGVSESSSKIIAKKKKLDNLTSVAKMKPKKLKIRDKIKSSALNKVKNIYNGTKSVVENVGTDVIDVAENIGTDVIDVARKAGPDVIDVDENSGPASIGTETKTNKTMMYVGVGAVVLIGGLFLMRNK